MADMAIERGASRPWARSKAPCPVCQAVRDEPCREKRGQGLPGWRFRRTLHPQRPKTAAAASTERQPDRIPDKPTNWFELPGAGKPVEPVKVRRRRAN